MGIEYYLIDESRQELFVLGRGDWSKVFEFGPPATPCLQALASFNRWLKGCENEIQWPFERLATFISERESVQLVSDAVEGSRGPIAYKICGSCYTSDHEPCAYHTVGKTMNLWFWDDERDGWKFPKADEPMVKALAQLPAAGATMAKKRRRNK
jgi:hypothetical protein